MVEFKPPLTRGSDMSVVLKIVDQTLGVHPPVTRKLRLISERITLRELLKRRIDEEVAELNAGGVEVKPLVVPTERESRLNGKTSVGQDIDAAEQFAAAVKAFERRRIVIIADGRQVLDLNQIIAVTPVTEIKFLKLVPLVGG
jgi:hypothetical protein